MKRPRSIFRRLQMALRSSGLALVCFASPSLAAVSDRVVLSLNYELEAPPYVGPCVTAEALVFRDGLVILITHPDSGTIQITRVPRAREDFDRLMRLVPRDDFRSQAGPCKQPFPVPYRYSATGIITFVARDGGQYTCLVGDGLDVCDAAIREFFSALWQYVHRNGETVRMHPPPVLRRDGSIRW